MSSHAPTQPDDPSTSASQGMDAQNTPIVEEKMPLADSEQTEQDSQLQEDDVLIEVGNVPEYQGVGTITFNYPKLPDDTDFETYRKTDPAWKKIVEWYNKENGTDKNAQDDAAKAVDEAIPMATRKQMAREKSFKDRHGDLHWKERFVLQHWPRNPKGPSLLGHSGGRHTSNFQPLWGSTLYDFYMVERIPGLAHLRTITTGSRMAHFCREIGELDFAKQQIEQADMEERPRELPPYPIWKLIEEMEELVRKRKHGRPLVWKGKGGETDSPFNYANDPTPWPVRPFSTFLPRLQSYIPLNSLPEMLIVHDPWNVLATPGDRQSYSDYSPVHDKTTLGNKKYKWSKAPNPNLTRLYKLRQSKTASLDREKANIDRESRSAQYRVPECREAHMYITPYRCIGRGNHSLIYQVELEVPRDLVVQPRQCHTCTKEALAKSQVYQEALAKGDQILAYSIAYNFVKYQLPPYCEHMDKGPIPGTARVSVVAKLALHGLQDYHIRHLRLEACNYQRFPRHMFEHYNGYNVIAPIHEPTPVGAVVPQFYGFYETTEKSEKGRSLSPIMLLEHCGTQTDASVLNFDDRRECYSLLLRLHHTSYVHNSVASRNFLIQHGPLQAHPAKRSKEHLRFRLADFGRTVKDSDDARGAMLERCEANDELSLGMI